jgi:hypothetical protein
MPCGTPLTTADSGTRSDCALAVRPVALEAAMVRETITVKGTFT